MLFNYVAAAPAKLLDALSQASGYQGAIVAVSGTLISLWILYHAVFLNDFPLTLHVAVYYPILRNSKLDSSGGNSTINNADLEWELMLPAVKRDRLPTVWNYWTSTLLLLFARRKARRSPVPGVLIWGAPCRIKGWKALPVVKWFVTLYRACHPSAKEVFGMLTVRLSEWDHEAYRWASKAAWEFAGKYPELIPPGWEAPKQDEPERFVYVLAYDIEGKGFTSLKAIVVPEIVFHILKELHGQHGKSLNLSIHEDFSRGRDNAALLRKVINAARMVNGDSGREVCRRFYH